MLVYTEQITPRLQYIFYYVFTNRLGLQLHIENDIDKFKSEAGLKVNYSEIEIDGVFQIIPNGLLFETTISSEKPDINISNNRLYFYSNDKGHVKFDVFSACFWLLSRYEEYQPFNADDHGRFLSSQSLAGRHDFLMKPLVDEWIIELKIELKAYFGEIKYKNETYKVIPTVDVDSPWCYKNKGFIRNAGGFLRDWLKVHMWEIPERLLVLSGLKQDAHYQFDWLDELYRKLGVKPVYFVLVGKYGPYDKTISQSNKAFKAFLSNLCASNEVGIHPSYNAATNLNELQLEIDYLNSFQSKKVTKSRQHFLKFKLPDYYTMLLEKGIQDDYSMGYADHIGFRAGTSMPFNFYNLQKEEATDLTIHPFSVMDVTLAQYMGKSTDEALEILYALIETIRNVNGEFVSLWHNESLSERMEWKGWKEIYIKTMEEATR